MTALDARALDALRELSNIGSGHAVTALARLTRTRLDMDVPEAWVGRAPGAVAEFLGNLDRDLVAVGLRLDGAFPGHLVILFTEADARAFATQLGHPVPEIGVWNPLAESALQEMGNIAASAFVSAIADMMGDRLVPNVPELVRGGGRECIDRLLEGVSGQIAFATRFTSRAEGRAEGLILVVPEEDEIATLLGALRLT